jgi:hypothetical protein
MAVERRRWTRLACASGNVGGTGRGGSGDSSISLQEDEMKRSMIAAALALMMTSGAAYADDYTDRMYKSTTYPMLVDGI